MHRYLSTSQDHKTERKRSLDHIFSRLLHWLSDLIASLECLWRSEAPLREVLPLCERISAADAKLQLIWVAQRCATLATLGSRK
ncbi:hypothetical protein PENSPDRAFT_649254 [Peniophora sp. CONT]|nr:hypothetical protein PENSPDRAFT_649254 [Peniophora sp. CONT]